MDRSKQLIQCGKKRTLNELQPGTLFAFGDDCIGLKSEYRFGNGLIEAFIVGSGELFWGGTYTTEEQTELMVQPLKLEEVVHCENCYYYDEKNPGRGHCKYFDILRADNDFCSSGEER